MTAPTYSLTRTWQAVPLWQWFLLAAATLGLSAASRLLTLPGIEFSALWPASGIFLGAVLALGKRALWVLVPTMLIWYTGLMGESWILAVFGAAGLSLGSVLASYLIQRGEHRISARGTHSPLHDLPNLYFKGAFVGSGLSALFGASGYMLAVPGAAEFALQDVVLVYWLLEALGVILFAPLFFILLRRPSFTVLSLSTDFKRRRLMLWVVLVVLALFCSIVLGELGDDRYAPIFAFALFPLVCWFAAEGSPPSLDFIIPNFAVIYVVFSLFQWGGLPPVGDITDLLRVLLQVGILAVMAQLVANINHQRHLLLDRFRRQAFQDYRTGLANDRGLYESIKDTLNTNRSGEHWLAYISLTDMHIIKELLALDGAVTVESVLTQQLQQFASNHSITARLSEGRFAILLPNTPRTQAEQVLNELYQRISKPVDEAGMSSNLRIAIGVTPVNGQLFSPQQYVSVAVQAANEAKNLALSMHWISDPKATAAAHYTMLNHFGLLKEAIEKDRLELFAQEIRPLRAPTEGLAFEVLVRMRDEQGSILSPAQFMPAAEAFGLMPALDRWVISHTLKFLAADPNRLHSISKCAINLSGASLSDPELAVFIGEQMDRYQVPADKLTFEITETEAIRSKVQAASFVLAIHQLGCRVALDDFGTGLASFEYLRQFHFDEIKIDGVFIRELEQNTVDERIVSAICQVASAMELTTVAEFVENASLSARLAALGVDFAQGYGIGKPQPLSELL
jgi:EAL domain-containing protein (putative c-di-GMP-specific phosphodiesterase class I)/GGDEF domain-containing protein